MGESFLVVYCAYYTCQPLDEKAIKALVTELQGADKGSRREARKEDNVIDF